MCRIVVIALCSLVVASLQLVSALAASPKALPAITFTAADGRSIGLAELKDKVVLLDFWASWCIPCRKSFPEIDRLAKDLEPKGLAVIAVNVDEQRKNADAFLSQYPHSMTVAFDPQGTAARAFDLQGMPSSVIVDRIGHIRFTHMGYTDKTIGQFRTEVMQLLAEEK